MINIKQFIQNVWQKHHEVLLWALGGGINTVLTYGFYLLFDLFLSYRLAFTVSYLVGIVFAYFYNSWVAFNSPFSLKKFLQFPLVYLVQYLLSMGLLEVFVQAVGVNTALAPIFVLIIVTPVTYLLSKLVIKGKNPLGQNHSG